MPSPRPTHTGYGYSYFFRALRDYHDGQLNRTEIMFFEYVLGMGEYYLKAGHTKFWHSYPRISADTGIAIDTLKKLVNKFQKLGFLSTKLTPVRGVPTTTFTVKFLTIAKNFNYLFGAPGNKKAEQYQRIRQRRIALVRMHILRLQISRRRY